MVRELRSHMLYAAIKKRERLSSLKKEKNSSICYNLDNLENIMLSAISQSREYKHCMTSLM